MTDIKIKRCADKENLKKLMRYIKATFANKTELASKANTSDLSTVATSGSYNDLLDKPTPFDVDLSKYYTKSEVDNLLSNIGSGTEGGDDAQNVLKSWPDGPEAHNAMWGGRNITDAFNNGTVSANIANGTFKDIFPGDYITKSVTISDTAYTVNWVIADCDYWINKGDDATTDHHVVIVPQTPIFNARMNPTSTTEGGYVNSEMYGETILQDCTTGIVNAFGSDHILEFRDYLTHSLNTSAVSSGITTFTGTPGWSGDWFSQRCNLMSEAMVYNGPHCASSALDNIMATRQMSAFRLSEKLINYNRQWWWLRDVVSSKLFASVGDYGGSFLVEPNEAHLAYFGVRPFALLR